MSDVSKCFVFTFRQIAAPVCLKLTMVKSAKLDGGNNGNNPSDFLTGPLHTLVLTRNGQRRDPTRFSRCCRCASTRNQKHPVIMIATADVDASASASSCAFAFFSGLSHGRQRSGWSS